MCNFLIPDDHNALVELSGSLSQWVRAVKCIQGTLEIVCAENRRDDCGGL